MDIYEALYKDERKKNEQLQATLTQIRNDYAHLKAVHEILMHRLRIIVEGEGR